MEYRNRPRLINHESLTKRNDQKSSSVFCYGGSLAMNKPMKKWLFFLHPRYCLLFWFSYFLFFVYDLLFWVPMVNAGTVISFDTVCESLFWLLKKKHLQVFQLPSTLPWFLQKNPPRTWILWWFSVDFIPRCWALVGLQPRMRVWKSLALEFQGKNLQKNVRWRGAFSMKVYRLDSLQPCQVNLMFLALEMSISITLKYSQLQ